VQKSEKHKKGESWQGWEADIKMDIKTKQRLFTFLYIVLIVGVLIFMIWFFLWIKSESAVCLKEPIEYFANKTGQMCYCNNGNGWLSP